MTGTANQIHLEYQHCIGQHSSLFEKSNRMGGKKRSVGEASSLKQLQVPAQGY